jgi:hypothetical protein
LIEDVSNLKNSVNNFEKIQFNNIGFVSIGIGTIGTIIAVIALVKSKN